MGIDKHAGSAVGDHGAGELGRRHHPAFHMHVAVAQAGQDVAAGGIYDGGVRADRVAGIADQGEPAGGDRHVDMGDDLARIDVHPAPVADDEVGRRPACGDVDEAADAIVPGLKVVWVRHGSSRPALDCFDGGSSIGISNQGSVIRDQVHCHSSNLRYLITDT